MINVEGRPKPYQNMKIYEYVCRGLGIAQKSGQFIFLAIY
jgi:hypothetical protein